jgi:hypothetical protein
VAPFGIKNLLYLKQILPAAEQGLCAAVLTQVSDVEDEINGLYTYDRRVCKADRERMLAIRRQLDEAFARWAEATFSNR